MNYRHPDLQEHLAAAYVAGTLRGGARRRFETLMRDDALLRRVVAAWETRLLPLVYALPPEMPPARVWQAIERRTAAKPTARPAWGWSGLALWRTVSAGLAIAVAALAFIVIEPYFADTRTQTLAVLGSEKAPSSMVVNRLPDSRLSIQAMQDLNALADGRTLELWAISPGGKPRSLGLVAARGDTVIVPKAPFTRGDTLAISLEPDGGSPTGQPTGPVVFTGTVI